MGLNTAHECLHNEIKKDDKELNEIPDEVMDRDGISRIPKAMDINSDNDNKDYERVENIFDSQDDDFDDEGNDTDHGAMT